jgi:hypothetical protein
LYEKKIQLVGLDWSYISGILEWWCKDVNKVHSLFLYATILWCGIPVVGLGNVIDTVIYFSRLLDITEKQLFIAISSGVALSVFEDVFQYFSSTYLISSISNSIFIYTELRI